MYQKKWVLLSASADQTSTQQKPSINDDLLLKSRLLNSNPSKLIQKTPSRWNLVKPSFNKTAVLITGELRCLSRSFNLFKRIGTYHDLFIVTYEKYSNLAHSLTKPEMIFIIEKHNNELNIDKNCPIGSIRQWHKLHIGLRLIAQYESHFRRIYSHVLKLRTDYFYVHPENLIRQFEKYSSQNGALVGASDKVFGGRRELMMTLKDFFQAITPCFLNKENNYWPINAAQIIASDDALKWYGMNWPVEYIGQPKTTECLRQRLIEGGSLLANKLSEFKPKSNTAYHRLFQGHPRFASEVSFARFLNFNGIPFRDCYSLRGFLYSDRDTCQ